jgi:L-fuconolactonase
MAEADPKLRQPVLAEDAAPVLPKNRFVGAIVVQAGRDPAEADWLFEIAERHAWVFAVTPWLLEDVPLPQHPKCRAVRTDQAGSRLSELADRGLVLDWVTALTPLPNLPPELDVVIDFDTSVEPEFWAPVVESWSGRRNTYLKFARVLVTALRRGWPPARMHGPIRHALACFGYDRVLFGSAWPMALPRFSWKEVLAYFTQSHSALPPGERWKLIGLNAARIYRLADSDTIARSLDAE